MLVILITFTQLFFCVTIRFLTTWSLFSNIFTKTGRLMLSSCYRLLPPSLRRLQILHGTVFSKTGNSLSTLPNRRSKIIERITKVQTFPGLVVLLTVYSHRPSYLCQSLKFPIALDRSQLTWDGYIGLRRTFSIIHPGSTIFLLARLCPMISAY